MSTIAQVAGDRMTVGVDTHKDTHAAAVKDERGRTLGTTDIPTTPQGYRALLVWAQSYGEIDGWGLEGTGSYGAGLARFLMEKGHKVSEVTRTDRSARRHRGKSDTVDAEAAARSVQAGEALAQPKTGQGAVETIRALRIVRSSAIKARTQAINEMKAFIVVAPAELREQLRNMTVVELVAVCSDFNDGELLNPLAGIRYALGLLARRIIELRGEVKALKAHLDRLVAEANPALRNIFGVGTEVAGQLLVTAGDNPGRLSSEASFARLCGVAPLEASSGKVVRHRLNRGGDRQANNALWRIAIVRMGTDDRTKAYVARRTAEGKSKKEIIRCLKRFIAREVFLALRPGPAFPQFGFEA